MNRLSSELVKIAEDLVGESSIGGISRFASLQRKVQNGVQKFFMNHAMGTGETYDEFMERLSKEGGRPEDYAEEIIDEIDPNYDLDIDWDVVEQEIKRYFESGDAKRYWRD